MCIIASDQWLLCPRVLATTLLAGGAFELIGSLSSWLLYDISAHSHCLQEI
jgi:hypothetical protein